MVLTALLAAFCSAAARADDTTAWIADERGCKAANPFPQLEESITWSGACKDGFADGEGVLVFLLRGREHSRFTGTLVLGWAQGRGVLQFPDGSKYQGEWAKSQENGQGRREWPDGSWYEGAWKDGQPHGQGEYRRPDGRTFTGEWIDGVYQGSPADDQRYDPNRT
jgi:hypothetical protein